MVRKTPPEPAAKGDCAFGPPTFISSTTLPAFASGVLKARFGLPVLGAMASGACFTRVQAGLSSFLSKEVVERIGDTGSRAILGVLVIVAIGLGIRAGYARWHAARQGDQPGQPADKSRAP